MAAEDGSYLPPVVIAITGDDRDFVGTVAEVKAMLADLAKSTTDVGIGLAQEQFDAGIAEIKGVLIDISNQLYDIHMGADTGLAVAEIEALRALASRAVTMPINADISGAVAAAAAARVASDAAAGGSGGKSFLEGLLGGALWGSGGGGFLARLMSPLTMLSSIFGAKFMTLGALAGFGPEHLALTGVGLLGSLAGGGIGAGLLGLGSLGVEGVGMGTDMAGIGQAAGDIKQYGQLQSQMAQMAAVYGKGSVEYKNALYEYQQWAGYLSKGTIAALAAASQTENAFHVMFDKVTGDAETSGANIIDQAIKVGMKFLPTIGKYAAENMTIIQKDLQPLFAWLEGPGLRIFNELEEKFTKDLPTAMGAFDQGVELLIRVIGLVAPQTGGLTADLDKLFTKLNGPGWSKFAGEIEKMIGLWHVWSSFFKILAEDIADIFGKTAGLGESIVQLLTGYLTQLHKVLTTAGESTGLSEVFKLHKQEVLELIGAIIQFGQIMTTIYIGAAPLLIKLATDALKVINAVMGFARHIPGGSDVLGIGLLIGRFVGLGKVLKTVGITAFYDSLKILAQGFIDLATTAIPALDGALGGMDIAADANPIGLIALAVAGLGAAIYELVKHWNAVWGFIKSHSLLSAFGALGIPIVGPFIAAAILIATHWKGVWNFMKGLGEWFSRPFVHFFTSIPSKIEGYFGDLESFFKDLPGAIVGFVKGLPADIAAIFHELPGLALEAISNLGFLLGQGVGDAIEVMVRITELELKGLYLLFTRMPGIIIGLVSSAMRWLVPTGEHIITGLVTGILNFAPKLWNWFLDLPANLLKFFTNAAHWLTGSGGDSLSGFLKGIVKFYLQVQKWFLGLPGKILSFFGKADTWLLDAGVALITGFINGLESKIPHLKGIINGIISTIKSLPVIGGLIGSPSPYFIKVGEAMMQGLEVGTKNNQGRAVSAVLDTSNRLKTIPFNLNGHSGVGGGGVTLSVNAEFNIYAPGGNAAQIKTAIEQGSAEQFAKQVLASTRAGAGTNY